MSPTSPPRSPSVDGARLRARRDLGILLVLALVVFAALTWFRAFERVVAWSHRHEAWPVGEAVTLVVVLAVATGVFAARRWQDVQQEQKRLRDAAERMARLERLLPICSGCRRIRNEQGRWLAVEEFLAEAANTQFTHGLCQECGARLYPGAGS